MANPAMSVWGPCFLHGKRTTCSARRPRLVIAEQPPLAATAEAQVQVDALRELLTEGFQYETDYYQIPSARWETALFSKVADFLHKYDDPQCLVVIYYGGHGYNGKDTGHFKWAA